MMGIEPKQHVALNFAALLATASCAVTAPVRKPYAPPDNHQASTIPEPAIKKTDADHGKDVNDVRQSDFKAARITAVPISTPLSFRWPLPIIDITSFFGRRVDPVHGGVRFHRGVDIDAHHGAEVRATASGRVVSAKWMGGYGRRLVIEHPNGFQSVYAHLAAFLVTTGGVVTQGQPIGRVGRSGRATGTHLHFELTHWGEPVDPFDFVELDDFGDD